MSETSILVVRPKQISASAKKKLDALGVVVIETDDPGSVRFMRPNAELSSTEMLVAALKAIKTTTEAGGHMASRELAAEIIAAVLAKGPTAA